MKIDAFYRALVVEDMEVMARHTMAALRAAQFSPTWADSLTQAATHAGEAWHVIFLDLLLPETSRESLTDAVTFMRGIFPDTPLIVLSAYLPELKAFDLLRKGADICIHKPLIAENIPELVHRAVCVNAGRVDQVLNRLEMAAR